MKIKKSKSIILSFMLDYLTENNPQLREKAVIFQLNCCILVAFDLEICDFFSFCPYFDLKFGPLFAWLSYINDLHKPWYFDEYSQSTTIKKIRA